MDIQLKKQAVSLLSTVLLGALPIFAQAEDLAMLPQPIEVKGTVQNVEQYDCTRHHRYWCGQIAGIVWINGDNGETVSRYLKRDSKMSLNGNATVFEGIQPGDEAVIIYFKDDMWATSLELERTGS